MSKRGISEVDGVPGNGQGTPRFDHVERTLDVAMFLGDSSGAPRMPWETNPFLRDVMGPAGVPWLRPPAGLRSMNYVPQSLQPARVQKSVPEKKEFVRRVVHHYVSHSDDSERSLALLSLRVTLCLAR